MIEFTNETNPLELPELEYYPHVVHFSNDFKRDSITTKQRKNYIVSFEIRPITDIYRVIAVTRIRRSIYLLFF